MPSLKEAETTSLKTERIKKIKEVLQASKVFKIFAAILAAEEHTSGYIGEGCYDFHKVLGYFGNFLMQYILTHIILILLDFLVMVNLIHILMIVKKIEKGKYLKE